MTLAALIYLSTLFEREREREREREFPVYCQNLMHGHVKIDLRQGTAWNSRVSFCPVVQNDIRYTPNNIDT